MIERNNQRICDDCKRTSPNVQLHRHPDKSGAWLCSTCYVRGHYAPKKKFKKKEEQYGILPFLRARQIVNSWNLKNRRQYYEYIRETRPAGIPYSPQLSYKHKGWKSWKDWLGTERLPFAEARDVVRSLVLKEVKQYFEYAKNEGLPK